MNRRHGATAVISPLHIPAAVALAALALAAPGGAGCARAPEAPATDLASQAPSLPDADRAAAGHDATGPGGLPPGHPAIDPGAAAAAHGAAGVPGPADRVEAALRGADPKERARRARTIAVVNGEPVTLRDLEVRLEEMHGTAEGAPHRPFDLDRLMFRMVNDLLLAQEARTLGMAGEEPTRGQVARFRREAMLQELEREQVLSKARVTDAEVRTAFQEQYRRLDLRVITVDDRKAAEGILAEVKAGADMAALAARRSHDPYATRGGLASGLPRRDLSPEIGALAAGLKPGEAGGPVMTDLGWSVLRLEGTQEADPHVYETAAPILRDLLTLEKVGALRADLAARLETKHPVRVEQAVLAAIVPERLTDGRLAPKVADRAATVARIGAAGGVSAGEYADALLLRWSGIRSEDAARAAGPILLKRLVDRALLLAEAEALGYGKRPDVARRARDYETRLLVQRYLEEVLGKEVAVGQEEMQAWYEAHRSDFPRPPRLRVAQITVAEAAQAQEIAAQLERGADVAWLARQRSTDRFAAAGGDRGWMVPRPGGDEVNDALMTARPGQVLGPFGQPGDFTVLKVAAREDQGLHPYAEVSGNVRSAVFSEKFRTVLDERVTRLRARARIEVKEDVLATLEVSGTVDGPPAAAPARGGAR
jgi:parvulin-like peptidyl-prolyl isomerase